MLQLRRGINDPLPRAHLIETDATDELILHASKDDDPSTITHPPPPPRYPNLDEDIQRRKTPHFRSLWR